MQRLENLAISDIPGENVETAISQIRGAIERLKHIKKTPEDLVYKLLLIFQTTSAKDFNDSFKLMQKQRMLSKCLDTSTGLSSSLLDSAEKDLPNKLCELAETLYHEKVATREWSGATTKGKASSFTAGSASAEHVTCWNCGDSGHSLQVCPKAKNQPAIALRKKAQQKIWKANGTSSGGGRGQGRGGGRGNGGGRGRGRGRGEGIPTEPNFPLPTAQENNKRVIGGKPMFFIKSRNLWVADKYPPEAPAAHVATTPPVAIQPPPAAGLVATASNAAARQQAIDVAVANATRSMGTALSGLAEQFRV